MSPELDKPRESIASALPPLILASQSPRRQALLEQLGIPFHTVPADEDEISSDYLTPREVCLVNAYRKARVVAKKHPDALVIGADTVVFLGKESLGKPRDLQDAEEMLLRLQGRAHEVVTGVCLLHLRRHRQRVFSCTSEVTFHPLTRHQIRRYLEKVNPLDKAGAYAIQEFGELLVERVEGSFTNVVGLPLEQLRQELETWAASDTETVR